MKRKDLHPPPPDVILSVVGEGYLGLRGGGAWVGEGAESRSCQDCGVVPHPKQTNKNTEVLSPDHNLTAPGKEKGTGDQEVAGHVSAPRCF